MLAQALLAAGLGEAAWKEAEQAVTLEPTLAFAHRTLGFVRGHDLFGRSYQKGHDRAGSIAAYRRAKELDPKDSLTRSNLAIALEYDAEGVRYHDPKALAQAVAEYQALRTDLEDKSADGNLVAALFYLRRFRDLEAISATLEPESLRPVVRLVATAGLRGGPAVLAEARRIDNQDERRQVCERVGNALMELRMYAEAAPLLEEAAALGAPDAVALRNRAAMLRGLRRHETLALSDAEPRGAALRLMLALLDEGVSWEGVLSHMSRDLRKEAASERSPMESLRRSLRSAPVPPPVMRDLLASIIQTTVEGDEQAGFRVRLQAPGKSMSLYLLREDGRYRTRATDALTGELAREALRRAEQGDEAGARRWLQWAREELPRYEENDPLGVGALLRAGPLTAQAAALVCRNTSERCAPDLAKRVLSHLQAGRAAASAEAQASFDAIMARTLLAARRPADALPPAERLAALHPDSELAWEVRKDVLLRLGRHDALRQAAEARLKRSAKDASATYVLATLADLQRDYRRSMSLLDQLRQSGQEDPSLLNNLGWHHLFVGSVGDAAIQLVQRAVDQTQRQSSPSLHTLAALYAEVGRCQEARDTLLSAIEAHGEVQGDDSYVVGRMAEHYGQREAAIAAYRRVPKPEQEDGVSTYLLAQRRLGQLGQAR